MQGFGIRLRAIGLGMTRDANGQPFASFFAPIVFENRRVGVLAHHVQRLWARNGGRVRLKFRVIFWYAVLLRNGLEVHQL